MKSLPQTPPVPEESLLEVWSRAAEPDVLYAMLTAYQFSCSHDENTARNCRLRADVREAGFGFWIINGFWFENESTPGQEYVAEESFFVSVPAG